MTRGVAEIHEKSHPVKQRKREAVKKQKFEMVLRAGKRSSGKQGRKKFPAFPLRKITIPGCSPNVIGKKQQCQFERMKSELQKLKGKMRDSLKWLSAAKVEANETEAKLELLVATRDELMGNFMEMKATEAFLMHQLGFI